MKEVLKMMEELDTLLWKMACDYNDVNYNSLGEARGISGVILRRLEKETSICKIGKKI